MPYKSNNVKPWFLSKFIAPQGRLKLFAPWKNKCIYKSKSWVSKKEDNEP